ncbi:4,5-dioxygenase [Chromobacterium sphagni]|uniref:4,5-dioxygenase n=1 Tax=Chromobacterium sphagni TaxID=1903179 RepID=A0A1S1WT96_9NEIS|nr:DOPA 4,5-dioxygenase family protein [Chromobacterium sphagni]OHX10461.1 4,5-dioxygenase [Chromobacterium sphagni]
MSQQDREISGFHAHVYFDASHQTQAKRLWDAIQSRFDVTARYWREAAFGPHPSGAYQVDFSAALFGELVPWLMLHREGLDILVHPLSGDDVEDHTDYAMWLGAPVALDVDFLRRNGRGRERG